MVDEKPKLNRQLDAIPSELRAKPLKRRRVRLKRGDNVLEKTTNELLSKLANEKTISTTNRKPLPAISTTGKNEKDWFASETNICENRVSNEETNGFPDINMRLNGRKRERNADAESLSSEMSKIDSIPTDFDVFICCNKKSTNHRRRPPNQNKLSSSNDLDWLNDNVVADKKRSRRRNNDDVIEKTLQRLMSEDESELTNKLALTDTRSTRRRSRRHQAIDDDVTCEKANSVSTDDSQIDGSLCESLVSRPRRRRNLQSDETLEGRSDLHYTSDAFSDDMSASYDPSLLSSVAPKLRTQIETQTNDVGIFISPKRHKKRQRESFGNKEESIHADEIDASWPDVQKDKQKIRQTRKTSYRKYLPPLVESITKPDSIF